MRSPPLLSATPPASHLADSYSIFSREYRFLSPAVSSLLLQTNNLRTSLLYEKDSPRVRLFQEMYHSPDGVEFGISHAPNSPAKDLQMATLGKLISVLLTEEEGKQKEKLSALIFQDLNQTPYWQAREPARVRSSANTFANKILTAVNAPTDEAGMEEMLVYQAFVTAAWMKAETKSDLIPFFQSLPVEVFHKKKAKNWPAWGEIIFTPKNYHRWSDRLKSRSFRKSDVPAFLQENLDLLAFGNEYHRNVIQTVPELIKSRTVQLEIDAATHSFGDCGDRFPPHFFAKTKKIFRMLLDHPKLDLEKEYSSESLTSSVLMHAAMNCELYKVKALLEHGADPNHLPTLEGVLYRKEFLFNGFACGKEIKALFSETKALKKAQPKARE